MRIRYNSIAINSDLVLLKDLPGGACFVLPDFDFGEKHKGVFVKQEDHMKGDSGNIIGTNLINGAKVLFAKETTQVKEVVTIGMRNGETYEMQ